MTFSRIGTINQNQNQPSHSEGGERHGETGSIALAGDTSKIAEWLATKAPTDTDKAAVSRARSHGVTLEVEYRGMYPENAPSYTLAIGCSVNGAEEQRNAALADLRNFQEPAPIRVIEGWLAELSVLTAGRGPDGISAEAMLTAYSSRLSKYPADVVRHALFKESWKWFPTWCDLEKVCESKSSPRRHMIAELSKPPAEPEPQRRPATQEEQGRIQALIDEKFPTMPKAQREAAVNEVLKGDCMTDGAGYDPKSNKARVCR